VTELITILDIIFLIPLFLFAFYLAFLTVLAMTRKMRTFETPRGKQRHFAVLVPAHNEELVIEQTLTSLSRIGYPNELFDVLVIADNCTDRTAEISRGLGATVFERFDEVNIGKGHALRWCLDQIIHSPKEYDAFAIVDADTVVSSNFLTVMNAYLEDGAQCIQSSDMVIAQPGLWSPEMTRVAFILHNYVRPLGRMVIGCSSGLNGNGMCFSRKLIETSPWNAYSRVEDLEHFVQLALEGIKVQFAPEAVVNAIMPSDPRNAETQRKRWEIGRFPLIKKYTGPLLLESLRRKSFMVADVFIELITPAFVNMFIVSVIGLVINLSALAFGITWLAGPSLLWGVAVLMEVFHVLAGLKLSNADDGAYLALLNFPRFAIWKLAIYLKTWLKGDDRSWVRTERETQRSKSTGG
jgi:1,2-diacylglycerol 3-beta-glucosyltransferase